MRLATTWSAVLACVLLLPAKPSFGQTDPRMLLTPWATDKTWGETNDTLLYQEQGHVRGERLSDGSDVHAQPFWWDSIGRFRLGTTDPNAPVLAYRYVTQNFDSNSPSLPDHLDELSMAAGVHLGELSGGRIGAVVGAGFSGDLPFADSEGVFGIAHLLWQRKVNETDQLVLSVDYNGVAAFLPDIPLPGFEYAHRSDDLSWAFGFPRSSLDLKLMHDLRLSAYYAVPYTADVVLEYRLSPQWGVFGGYHNFFNAFRLDEQPLTERLFEQMSRAEIGIHYTSENFVMEGAYFDISFSVGYAFAQEYSHGFDVRDMDPLAQISDEPYAAVMLRGRF